MGLCLLETLGIATTMAVSLAPSLGARIDDENSGQTGLSPSHVNSKSTITIELPENHPENLLVFTPGNRTLYLFSKSKKVVPRDQLLSRVMRLDVSALMGTLWADGRASPATVFKAPGCYMFYFSENDETSPANTAYLDYYVRYDPKGAASKSLPCGPQRFWPDGIE